MKSYLSTALLALSLIFLACSGSSDNPQQQTQPQPVVSISISSSASTVKPTKSVELTVTAHNTQIEWPHPLQVAGTFTVTNNKVAWTLPDTAGTYEFKVTAQADSTKQATARVTVNTDRTKGYLIESLTEAVKPIVNRDIPESEWPIHGQTIKDAFVHGWQYDSYAVNIPFTTEEMKRGLQPIKIEFQIGEGGNGGGTFISLGTRYPSTNIYNTVKPENVARVFIHELGHCMGLNEMLTELQVYGFEADKNYYEVQNKNRSHVYKHAYYKLLMNKVGDTNFWQVVFRSSNPNEAFANLWDENMPVSHENFARFNYIVAELAWTELFWSNRELDRFLAFSGITDIERELSELPGLFSEALEGNTEAQTKLDWLFDTVERYCLQYPNIGMAPIWNNSVAFFIQNTKTQAPAGQKAA